MNISPLQFIQIALENPTLAARYMAAQGKAPPPLQTIPALPQAAPADSGSGIPGSDPTQPSLQLGPPPQQFPPQTFAQSLTPENALPAMGDVPTIPDFMPGPEGKKKGEPVKPEGPKKGVATTQNPPASPAPQAAAPFDMRTSIPQWNGNSTPPTQAPQAVTPAGQTQLSPMPVPTEIAPLPVPPAPPPAAATVPVPAAASPGGPPTAPAAGPATPMDAFAQSLLGLAAPSTGGGSGGGRLGMAPAPFIQGALNPQTIEILKQALMAAQGPGQLNLGR